MSYPEMNVLIDALLTGTKAHICFHDLSGMTDLPLFHIRPEYTIHSRPFCDSAKKTKKGMKLCLHCKRLTIDKAAEEKKGFAGYCPFGVYELAVPLIIRGETAAVVYLGNLQMDSGVLQKNILRAGRITEADTEDLLKKAKTLETASEDERYWDMLNSFAAYAQLLYEKQSFYEKQDTVHWTIRQFIRHIDNYYSGDLTIGALARLYHINEQYAGRLFQAQTGRSFHEYLNHVRLEHCARWLTDTDITAAEAAYHAGYHHVTYFNRMFLKEYGQTPTAYRKSKRKSESKM